MSFNIGRPYYVHFTPVKIRQVLAMTIPYSGLMFRAHSVLMFFGTCSWSLPRYRFSIGLQPQARLTYCNQELCFMGLAKSVYLNHSTVYNTFRLFYILQCISEWRKRIIGNSLTFREHQLGLVKVDIKYQFWPILVILTSFDIIVLFIQVVS